MREAMDRQNCDVCGDPLVCSWTDYHGEAECCTCGTPYMVIRYDENNKRIEGPAQCALSELGLKEVKDYWGDTRCKVPGGTFIGRYQGVATQSDIEAWTKWKSARIVEVTPIESTGA